MKSCHLLPSSAMSRITKPLADCLCDLAGRSAAGGPGLRTVSGERRGHREIVPLCAILGHVKVTKPLADCLCDLAGRSAAAGPREHPICRGDGGVSRPLSGGGFPSFAWLTSRHSSGAIGSHSRSFSATMAESGGRDGSAPAEFPGGVQREVSIIKAGCVDCRMNEPIVV